MLISQYFQQKWTTENGLPHNSITAITQTKDGYMWFGSSIGLIRFNGIDFTLFNKLNHPGMNLNDIWCLAADDSNNLWIGTNGSGLVKYKDGKFKSYSSKDGLEDNSVWSLYPEKDGTLWIGTANGGIAALRNGKFKSINTDNGLSSNSIWCFSRDHLGNLWIGTDGAFLNEISNGKIKHYDLNNGFPGDYVMASFADSKGNLWFGAAGVGLIKYTDGKLKVFTEKEGLINNIIWSIKEDAKGNIWVGTDGGLIKISNGKFYTYTEKNGLSSNVVKTICIDQEGNIWTGTNGGGIIKFTEGPIKTYTVEQGLPHNNIFSICQDKLSNIWFGTSRGLSCLTGDKFHNYYYPEGFNSDNVLSLLPLRNGSICIGTDGSGIYFLSNGKFKNFNTENGLSTNTIWSMLEDKNGTIWLGTDGKGIIKYNNGKFSELNMDSGLSGEYISCLLEDHSGIIWAGTKDDNGLNRIENNSIKIFQTREGLLSNNIYSLFEDKENGLWIGTDAGLNKMKNGKIYKYSKEDGLYFDVIKSINEDNLGKLWFSSSSGIFSISKKEFEKFDKKLISKINITSFDIPDGMKSSECSSGSPSSFKTDDGNIWFPTIHGASVINPSNIISNKHIPKVIIDSAMFNGSAYYPGKKEIVPPGEGYLEFYFSALSYSAPQKVMYKYKLEGYDSRWIYGGNNHTAKFTKLSPGNYKFIVIASNNKGVWNTNGASFEFILQPYYYQTSWFYALSFGLLYVVVLGSIKIRTNKLKKREKFLSQKIEERSAELIEENKFRKKAEEEARSSLQENEKILNEKTNLLNEKEVLLKEIHHRVKNNLQVISSLLYLNSKKIKDKDALNIFKDSQNRVKSIALVHERLYRSHDLNKINFKEYIRQLTKDLFISYAVDPQVINLELDINNILINIDLAVPCGLIINELISNSLKYAFKDSPNDGKGVIRVSFNQQGDELHLLVSDNGIGIPKGIKEIKKDSLGLQLVETLTTQLDGFLNLDTTQGTAFNIRFKVI